MIDEIYKNPTVKEVAFEIRFPNLFFLESKIGDFQLQILSKFPNSSLILQKNFLLTDVGSEHKIEDIAKQADQESCTKIWQFKSEKNFHLNVTSNSLNIVSKHHKTYNLEGGDKFRDIIKFVLDPFLKITSIPSINRIGLRYINECPIPNKEDSAFKSYYNTTFPLDRFTLTNVVAMEFKTVTKKNDYFIRYAEILAKKTKDDSDNILVLDFDGFANNIKSENYLTITDSLHTLISNEYEKSIKQPVIDYMKK